MSKRKAPKQVEQFTALPLPVQRLLRGQPIAQAVYQVYLRNAGPRGKAQIGNKAVATEIGRSVRTVIRAREELEALDLIRPMKTRRTGLTWLPCHPGYAADWGLYQARKAAKEARETATHMEVPSDNAPPYGSDTKELRSDTNGTSGGDTSGTSIFIDVLPKGKRSIDVFSPSGGSPSGAADPSARKEDRPPPGWAVDEPDQTKNGTQPKQSEDLWPGQEPDQEPKKAPAAPLVMKRTEDETRAHLLRKSRNVIADDGHRVPPSDDLLASLPGHWAYYDGEWFDLVGEDPKKMIAKAIAKARRKPVRFAAERSGGWAS